MKNIGMISWWLVIVGAVNWGLVGAFNMNLVTMIFGTMPMIETIVYILVGLSGVYLLAEHFGLV